MRDVHCHILPGVDDGARTMSESLLMLSAAMKAGVTSIVCTPRCCDPFFNFERMWQAFLQLKHRASAIPGAPELSMGFEVDYYKLRKLGMNAAVQLGNDQGEFLLRFPDGVLPLDWEYMVHNLQRRGFKVIIAHPERCREVQRDIEVARRFVLAGCELQIAADCLYGSLLDPTRRTAKKLVQAGIAHHLASEARRPDDYETLVEAMAYFKRLTDSSAMENKSTEEVERECAEAEARAALKGKGSRNFADEVESESDQGAPVQVADELPALPHEDEHGHSCAPVGRRAAHAKGLVNFEDLPLPVEEDSISRKPYEVPAQGPADTVLDAMFDEEPIRGKHARRA